MAQTALNYLHYLFPKLVFSPIKFEWLQDSHGHRINVDLFNPELKLAIVLRSGHHSGHHHDHVSKSAQRDHDLVNQKLALEQNIYLVTVVMKKSKSPDWLYNVLDQALFEILYDLKIQSRLVNEGMVDVVNSVVNDVVEKRSRLTPSQALLLKYLKKWFEPKG